MLVATLAISIQILFLSERLLHAFLSCLLGGSESSPTQTFARRWLVGRLAAQSAVACTTPLQLLAAMGQTILSRAWLVSFLCAVVVFMAIAAPVSGPFVAHAINVYNSGVGVVINTLLVKPWELASILAPHFVPLWNAVALFLSRCFFILFELLLTNTSSVALVLQDVALFGAALGMSVSRWFLAVVECSRFDASPSTLPTDQPAVLVTATTDMACIANDNKYILDVMTPGLYVQQFASHVNSVLSDVCPTIIIPVQLFLYPVFDYNLYMSVHAAINFVLHGIVALPLRSNARCSYAHHSAQASAFTAVEKKVMCAPDFTMWFALHETLWRSLGNLVDNWLAFGLVLAESAFGLATDQCDSASVVRSAWEDASDRLDRTRPKQLVSLTPSLYAITDGLSTVFHSMDIATPAAMAIGHWPFAIEPRFGVAAVKFGDSSDTDDRGNERTGMLGCACVDSKYGIRLVCASVPYRGHAYDSDDEFLRATQHNVSFYPPKANKFLRCDRVRIKVSSLRYSRKRYSVGSAQGIDIESIDGFDILRRAGERDPEAYTADASIYVHPNCVLTEADPACVAVFESCFPFCYGLHVAGASAQGITLYNAGVWDSFIAVAQSECMIHTNAIGEQCARGVIVVGEEDGVSATGACGVSVPCVASDRYTSIIPADSLDPDDSVLAAKRVPSIRLASQPFVAAGDVFLFYNEDTGVTVTRLYDNNRGDYTLQNEQLTLLDSSRTLSVVRCIFSDTACHVNAVRESSIVLPPADRLDPMVSHPVAQSQWGIHYTINPDNSVLGNLMSFCQGSVQFGLTLDSAYGPARVWTVKTAQAGLFQTASDPALQAHLATAYMRVPGWLSTGTRCEEVVNVKVVDIEYMNEANLVVTVLRTAPKYYDTTTGTVCDGCFYKYARYFINPNFHACTDIEESEDVFFTCWRSEEAGMFQTKAYREADFANSIGLLCPALRRLPEVGALGSELAVASAEVLRFVFDLVITLPVAASAGDLAQLWTLRANRMTFHAALDSSGNSLFSVEALLRALDRAWFHAVGVLNKLAAALSADPGAKPLADTVNPILIGTAKVVQHMSDTQLLAGPLLYQLQRMQAVGLEETLQQAEQIMPQETAAGQQPSGVGRIKAFVTSIVSSFKLNVRVFRRVFVRLMRYSSGLSGIAQAAELVVGSVVESRGDLDRSLLSNIRIQCDGLGQILGTSNPLARTVRYACFQVPDGLQGVFDFFAVLFVEYPVMTCACKYTAERNFADHIEQQCLASPVVPTKYRAAINAFRASDSVDASSLCNTYIDEANDTLERAFDRYFQNLYQVGRHIAEVPNWILSVFGLNSPECADPSSPYVVSIVPSPADYFAGCANTDDCRSRCGAEIAAFESVFAQVADAPPIFRAQQTVAIESRFFSRTDIESRQNLAPFQVNMLVELAPAACAVVCRSTHQHPLDRCVFIAGVEGDTIRTAYYCIPADYILSVFAYVPPAPLSVWTKLSPGTIEHIAPLSTAMVAEAGPESVVLLVRDTISVQNQTTPTTRVEVVIPQGSPFTIHQTFTRSFFGQRIKPLQQTAINKVFTFPAQAAENHAYIFIQGVRPNDISLDEEITCVGVSIDVTSISLADIDPIIDAQKNLADYSGLQKAIFSANHIVACYEPSCLRLVHLPIDYTASVRLYHIDLATSEIISEQDIPTSAASVAKIIGIGSLALSLVSTGALGVNSGSISPVAPAPPSTNAPLSILTCVASDTEWVSTLAVDISGNGAVTTSASVSRDTNVDIAVGCSINNCIGCQTAAPTPKFVEVQARCFAASQCATARCVGTQVNMRKPLCNLGNLIASVFDALRVASRAVYSFFARNIILIVELSKNRRSRYELDWVDRNLMDVTCNLKDSVTEASAVFTSIIAGVDGLFDAHADYRQDARNFDADYHPTVVLSSMSLTKFISSVFMSPVIGAIAAKRAVSCFVNDSIVLVQTDGSDTRIEFGSRDISRRDAYAAGDCLSASMNEALRDMGKTPDLKSEAKQAMSQFTNTVVRGVYGSVVHPVDGILTWVLGIIDGLMDWVQTLDWYHCKPPVSTSVDVATCACGDLTWSIPQTKKDTALHEDSLWCTGPLLIADAAGNDLLIWNRFSLADLLDTDYDAYVDCLARVTGPCRDPTSSTVAEYFAMQGVVPMQVISRCRANYQAKTWDYGALALATFSPEQWRLRMFDTSDFGDFQARLQRIRRHVRPIKNLSPDTLRCLDNALRLGRWNHNCAQQHYVRRGLTVDQFFTYKPAVDTSFAARDACRLFSGNLKEQGSYGASLAPNPITLASRRAGFATHLHQMVPDHADSCRRSGDKDSDVCVEQEAKLAAALGTYHHDHIQPFLEYLSTHKISDSVRVSSWSIEGDELHQIVDCIVMGPFAHAEMHASFQMSDGSRFDVPKYHRGSPDSRTLPTGTVTGGSDMRQHIIGDVQRRITESARDSVVDAAQSAILRINAAFQDIKKLKCACPGSSKRAFHCCVSDGASSVADVTLESGAVLADKWDLGEVAIADLLRDIASHKIFDDIWTDPDILHQQPREFSADELAALQHLHLFKDDRTIHLYGGDEVMDDFTGTETPWQHCGSLLSGSFFTLPMAVPAQGGPATVDFDPADIKDPAEPGPNADAFMHGMEHNVRAVLARARRDSPVFWSHLHRYVPSDSVWCEDTLAGPTPAPTQPADVFSESQWYGLDFADDTVRGHRIDDVRHVAQLHCLCGWTTQHDGSDVCAPRPASLSCWAVPAALDADWKDLCGRGHYTSRADFFLLLRVLEEGPDEAWMQHCADTEPSITWGLLDSERTAEWFKGSHIPADEQLSLHELATRGVAGLRLGLLGNPAGSLASHTAKAALLRRQRSRANFAHNHTVAQPVCAASLAQHLRSNLTAYFRDVFVPMAHTVRESPASVNCFRWAVEYATHAAMQDVLGDAPAVHAQYDVARTWRARCRVQLEQISFCILRDIYALTPPDYILTVDHCPFRVAPGHGCDSLVYVTSTCLVMCDNVFYDPCRCSETSCENYNFGKSSVCPEAAVLDLRDVANHASLLVSTLHWPDAIGMDEASGSGEQLSLSQRARDLRQARVLSDDFDSVLPTVADRFAAATHGLAELDNGAPAPPDAFCDDLLDYWPADAQYPVGYHPTCACDAKDTNLRGFTAWMSSDADGALNIDPERLRNATDTANVFPAAHLVCDAVAYSVAPRELNPFFLETLWNPDITADPYVPVDPRKTSAADADDMTVRGTNPAQSPWDTPARTVIALGPRHSLGLIRSWPRARRLRVDLSGTRFDAQTAIDESWPVWLDADDEPSEVYAAAEDATTAQCAMHALYTCNSDADCRVHDERLACLHNTAEPGERGVCAESDSCFQHAHCADGKLCSADGVCVPARVYVENNQDVALAVRLYSGSDHCATSPGGLSLFEGVPDFLKSNGVCSFRDWDKYLQATDNADNSADFLRAVLDHEARFSDSRTEQTLRDRGMLKVQPNACDRSYDFAQDMGLCVPHVPATLGGTAAQTLPAARTWTAAGDIRFCDMQARSLEASGFLKPYYYIEDQTVVDSIQHLTDTLGPCDQFPVCLKPTFHIDGATLTYGRVVLVFRTDHAPYLESTVFREHSVADIEACSAFGYLANDQRTCIVDRFAVPLLDVLFHAEGTGYASLPVYDSMADDAASLFTSDRLRARFDSLLAFCPDAFSRDFSVFLDTFQALARAYSADSQAVHLQLETRVNNLMSSVFGGRRGFSTLDEYLTLSKCASHILSSLERRRSINSIHSPYAREAPSQIPAPGLSLYLFDGPAALFLPFRWFWQCVFVAMPNQGGAALTWQTALRTENADALFTCTNYQLATSLGRSTTGKTSVARLLRETPALFHVQGSGEVQGGQAFVASIEDAIAAAVDRLGLSLRQDVHCLRFSKQPTASADCDPYLPQGGTSCWTPLAYSRTELRSEPGASQLFLYNQVLEKIVGDLVENTENSLLSYQWTDSLTARGVISQGIELTAEVDHDARFVPSVRFPLLEKHRLEDAIAIHERGQIRLARENAEALNTYHSDGDPPKQLLADHDSTPYANLNDDGFCASLAASQGADDTAVLYRLEQGEVAIRDGFTLESLATELNEREVGFLRHQHRFSAEQVVFLVLTAVEQLLATTDNFRSGNLHAVTDLRVFEYNIASAIARAQRFAAFMADKTFPCSDQQTVINPDLQTNPHHTRLRECHAALREPAAWDVPPGAVLDLSPPASVLLEPFFPSFLEPPGQTFLDYITSSQLVASAADRICFAAGGRVMLANPFLASHLDLASGCDMLPVSGSTNTYVIDAKCFTRAGETCAAVHRNFHASAQQQCRNQDGVFVFRDDNDLPHFCDITPADVFGAPQSPCSALHGTLNGFQGTPLDSFDAPAIDAETVPGFWDPLNAPVHAATLLSPDRPAAIQLLGSDIAGHSLHFRIVSGHLSLQCAHLAAEPAAAASCIDPARVWLARAPEYWRWQQSLLDKHWFPDTPDSAWHCPLLQLTAFSNIGAPYSARAPSFARNARRFRHLTRGSAAAHPTVISSRALDMLRPARFMSEVQMCAQPTGALDPCRGKDHLYKALRWLRSSAPTVVEVVAAPESRCQAIVDWPHIPLTRVDGTVMTQFDITRNFPDQNADEYTPRACSVHDRLPPFAVQLQKRDVAALPPTALNTHPCRMGRLRRLRNFNSVTPFEIQGCGNSEDGSVYCSVYTFGIKEKGEAAFLATDPANSTVVRGSHTPRRRRCASCTRPATNVVDKGARLQPVETQQLSTGVPVALHPARAIAANLRRAVCPHAADSDACFAALAKIAPLSAWDRDAFLPELMRRAGARAREQQANATTPDDTALWARPWVFCDQSAGIRATPGSCAGSINKSTWLDPATRRDACIDVTLDVKEEAEPVQFCKLDEYTQELCQRVAQWNADLLLIFCRAAGLADCPDLALFYTPTTFSQANEEFVHTTIANFYAEIDATTCPVQAPGDAAGAQATTDLLGKCSANTVAAIKVIVLLIRRWVRNILEIMYYFTMTIIKLLEMIIAIFIGQLNPESTENPYLDSAANDYVSYWELLFKNVGQLLSNLLETVWRLVRDSNDNSIRAFIAFAEGLCAAVNDTVQFAYKIACIAVHPYAAILEFISGLRDNWGQWMSDNQVFQLGNAGVFIGGKRRLFQTEREPKPTYEYRYKVEDKVKHNQPDVEAFDKHVHQAIFFRDSVCQPLNIPWAAQGCKLWQRGVECAEGNIPHHVKEIMRRMQPDFAPDDYTVVKLVLEPGFTGCETPTKYCPGFVSCMSFQNATQEADPSKAPLPTPTRCWSTYVTYFGDARPLSCTPFDTCSNPYAKGIFAESDDFSNNLFDLDSYQKRDLVQCRECPTPPAGYADFGCDAVLKQCTCQVPEFAPTRCVSNIECMASVGASASESQCQFLDSELALSVGSVPCAACSGVTACYVAPNAVSGVCACALQQQLFAACPETEVGMSVWPAFDKLCLYHVSEAAARSVAYAVSFLDLTATSCMNINPGSAYCNLVTLFDRQGVQYDAPLLVAADMVSRRRLLSTNLSGPLMAPETSGVCVCVSLSQSRPLPQTSPHACLHCPSPCPAAQAWRCLFRAEPTRPAARGLSAAAAGRASCRSRAAAPARARRCLPRPRASSP